jgi:hypothetical protein
MCLLTRLLLRVILSFIFFSSFILRALETVITVINHKVSSLISRFSFASSTVFCFKTERRNS